MCLKVDLTHQKSYFSGYFNGILGGQSCWDALYLFTVPNNHKRLSGWLNGCQVGPQYFHLKGIWLGSTVLEILSYSRIDFLHIPYFPVYKRPFFAQNFHFKNRGSLIHGSKYF